jgi:hypothetical protein
MREMNQVLEFVPAAAMAEYSMAGFAVDRQPMLAAVSAGGEAE